MIMYRFVVVIAIILVMVSVSAAQLNFSTGWGKRASSRAVENDCKTSVDTVMLIYKIIQVSIFLFFQLMVKPISFSERGRKIDQLRQGVTIININYNEQKKNVYFVSLI